MFASTSFAEWTKVTKNSGGTFYIDFDRIRNDGGYLYFWELSDLFKPNKDGNLSAKIYNRGDSKVFRYKWLSFSAHKEPLGRENPRTTNDTPDKD